MKKILIAAAALVFAGGCVFTPNAYVDNVEFDLELPRSASPSPIRLGVFKNLSGSDRRFLMRRGDGQVLPLEYQRWRLSPELMLMRCMYGAFAVQGQESSDVPVVGAVVYRFEFDEREDSAIFSADFILTHFKDSARTVRIDVSAPVKKSDDPAAARAVAMSECAKQAMDKLAGVLDKK